jgi:hypothetical protein
MNALAIINIFVKEFISSSVNLLKILAKQSYLSILITYFFKVHQFDYLF